MRRRDLLRYLLLSPLAATLDVEQLLWTPKPMIVVPAFPMVYGVDWGKGKQADIVGILRRGDFAFTLNFVVATDNEDYRAYLSR